MNVLSMLFGAALVAIGVLVAALAERIRASRTQHAAHEVAAPRHNDAAPHQHAPRAQAVPTSIPVIQRAERISTLPPAAKPRIPGGLFSAEIPRHKTPEITEGGDTVISALVASGYQKAAAAEATWACSPAERGSLEGWTVAALRRCARGELA